MASMASDGGRPLDEESRRGADPTTVAGAISAVVCAPSMASPQYAKSYCFGAPMTLSCAVGGDCSASIPEQLADVKVGIAYLDGLGRTIQVRERMGGWGTSAGNPANVTQALELRRRTGCRAPS